MKYNPEVHHRRSIRLKRYDYSREGGYFLTICTQGRENLFGEIHGGEIALNEAGKMVEGWWIDISKRFEGVERDEFIVMPNHLHGIVFLVGADRRVCPGGVGEPGKLRRNVDKPDLKQGGHTGPPLPEIIQWFKTMTTNQYLRNVEKSNWPALPGRLWQRNYYEHIIRSENTLNHIREYVIANPIRWQFDRDNPAALSDTLEQDFWNALDRNQK